MMTKPALDLTHVAALPRERAVAGVARIDVVCYSSSWWGTNVGSASFTVSCSTVLIGCWVGWRETFDKPQARQKSFKV